MNAYEKYVIIAQVHIDILNIIDIQNINSLVSMANIKHHSIETMLGAQRILTQFNMTDL